MTQKIPPKLFWPGVVCVISLIWLSVLGYAWSVAENDPNFAVEENFYEASEQWDATQAQIRASEQLGWSLEVALTPRQTSILLELIIQDAEENPIENAEVSIVAFPNASASDRVKQTCQHSGRGVYTTLLELPRTGLWEVRMRAERGGDVFVDTIRVEMPETLVTQ